MVCGRLAHQFESQKSTRRSADTAEWAVLVPANGRAVLTASFDTRF